MKSSLEEPEEADIEKPLSVRLKYIFMLVVVMLALFLAAYLFS
jgi:hypothetical protein